jgi:hypothetical protein
VLREYRIETDAGVYNLKYTTKALVFLEQQFGMSINDIGKKVSENVSMTDLVKLFKAALIHENSNVTDEQIYSIIDSIGIRQAAEAIAKAFQYALGGEEEKN